MGQSCLIKKEKRSEVILSKNYDKGPRNDIKQNEQHIRLTEGCPNGCPYCAESKENSLNPTYYPIPKIVRTKVKLYDMNLISKPNALDIIKELGSKKVDGKKVYYELWCGVDYRYLTQKIADALRANRFGIFNKQNKFQYGQRMAWDWSFQKQYDLKNAVNYLKRAGYRPDNIMLFMICNWKIPYSENLLKLELCKIWGVKVADCYFDNQLMPNVKPIHWSLDQIKDFRRRCRRHNQMIEFNILPNYKGGLK